MRTIVLITLCVYWVFCVAVWVMLGEVLKMMHANILVCIAAGIVMGAWCGDVADSFIKQYNELHIIDK